LVNAQQVTGKSKINLLPLRTPPEHFDSPITIHQHTNYGKTNQSNADETTQFIADHGGCEKTESRVWK
jgi:hypothetical protein